MLSSTASDFSTTQQLPQSSTLAEVLYATLMMKIEYIWDFL